MKKTRGHALVMLLFLMTLAVAIITAGVALMILSTSSTNLYLNGNSAKTIAEAGMENALLRLLRNPSYTGETLTIGAGTATITVTGASSKTLISEGRVGSQAKKIEVTASINNILTVTSWKEIL